MTENPSSVPKRRRLEQKQETHERILEKAREIFARQGFHKTTIRAIADEARIAVGTVFAHFSDKAELFAAVFYDSLEVVVADAIASLPLEAPLIEQYLHLIHALLRYYGKDLQLSRDLYKENLFLQGPWGQRLEEQVRRFLGILAQSAQAAIDRGEISSSLEPTVLAMQVWAIYQSLLVFFLHLGTPDPSHALSLARALLTPLFASDG